MTSPSGRAFDHERLDVYAAALDFISLAHRIIGRLPRGRATLADQLERAATSIALNTAEGSGEFSRKEKTRFYRIALRSVSECSAVLDVGRRLHAIKAADADAGSDLLRRIAAMLVALIRHHERT